MSLIHIRYDGRSVDVDAADLGIYSDSSDADIRARAAQFLDVPVRALRELVIDRAPSGALILRPEAVYG